MMTAAAALLLYAPARGAAAEGDETTVTEETPAEENTSDSSEDSQYGATGQDLLNKWGKEDYMKEFKPIQNEDGSIANKDGVIKTGDPDNPTYSFRPADQVLSHMSTEDKAAFDARFGDMDLSNAYVQYGADGKPIGITLLQENGGMSLLSDADALARADSARASAAAAGGAGAGGAAGPGAAGVEKSDAGGQDDGFTEDYLDSFQNEGQNEPAQTPKEAAADAEKKLTQADESQANAFNVASTLADNLARDIGIQNLPQDLVRDLLDHMSQGPDGTGSSWPNRFAFGNDPGGSAGIFSNTWDGKSPHDSETGGRVVRLSGSDAATLQQQHEAWANNPQGYVPRSYDSTVAATGPRFEQNAANSDTAFGQLKTWEGMRNRGPDDGMKDRSGGVIDGRGAKTMRALEVDKGGCYMGGACENVVVGTRDATPVEIDDE